MRTLIICIDRDNDLGEKAGVLSPIIGRAANLDAAIRLASSDPEDSDINTIFGGINLYDKMKEEKIDAEIVSITGDKMVGILADRRISEQLDRILEQLRPERAILVSDGAEDESVLPIIQSRIKVDSVRRIIVQQHENLESTYYIIKQAFNNPKIASTFFIPIGLALVIYAISLYLGSPEVAVILIAGAIGLYILFRGTRLDDALIDFKESLMNSLQGGKTTFVMYLAALILSLIGTFQGAIESWDYYDQAVWPGVLVPLLGYINASISWYAVAEVLISAGKIIDKRLANEKIGKNWAHPFFIIAVGIFIWSGSTYLLVMNKALESYPVIGNGLQFIVSTGLGAIIIGTIGAWLSVRSSKGSTL